MTAYCTYRASASQTYKQYTNTNFSIGTTENGWTTDRACFEWFSSCFLPQAKARNTSGKPIALLMDGHSSHVTKELRTHAEDNGVHIYTFPSHTTHKLQPLDVGVFGPLQRAWQGRCVEILQQRNTEVTQHEFVREYLAVRNKVFTPTLIQKAFKNSGIHPLNPDIFTPEDFAPSQISSHKVHVPLSYPEPHLSDEADDSDRVDEWGSDWEDEGDSDEGEGEQTDNPAEESGDDDAVNLDSGGEGGNSDEGGREGETVEAVRGMVVGEDSEIAIDEPPTTSSGNGDAQRTQSSMETSDDAPSNPTPTTADVPHLGPRTNTGPSTLPTSVEGLEARVRELEAENESLHTHATMAYREINQLQFRINARKSKKEKGKGRVSISTAGGRWWTVGEGRRLALEKDAEDEAKAKAKEQAAAGKRAKADERQKQRASLSAPFSGAFSSKSKEDLKDIAWALSLAIDSKATKSDIQQLITKHLDRSPHLAEHPRFSGLYISRSRLKRPVRQPESENLTLPPPSTQYSGGSDSYFIPSFPPPATPGPVASFSNSAISRSPTKSPLSFEYTMIPPHPTPTFDNSIPFQTFLPVISHEEKFQLLYNTPIPSSSFYSHIQAPNPLHFSQT